MNILISCKYGMPYAWIIYSIYKIKEIACFAYIIQRRSNVNSPIVRTFSAMVRVFTNHCTTAKGLAPRASVTSPRMLPLVLCTCAYSGKRPDRPERPIPETRITGKTTLRKHDFIEAPRQSLRVEIRRFGWNLAQRLQPRDGGCFQRGFHLP